MFDAYIFVQTSEKSGGLATAYTPQTTEEAPNEFGYKWPYSAHLLDIIRCSFQANDARHFYEQYQLLLDRVKQSKGKLQIARVKNGFYNDGSAESESRGYRDLKINLIFRDSRRRKFICEVQFLLKEFLHGKKRIHKLYSIVRRKDFFDMVNASQIESNKKSHAQILIDAIKNNNMELLRFLLEFRKLNINDSHQFSDGGLIKVTPLSYAVEFGCEEIVKYLLTQNVDLSTVNESGHTVLHLACMRGKHDIVAAIAEKADINAKDKHRMTPFSVACRYGKVGAMQVLIDKDIDINYEDSGGWTGFHLACFHGMSEAVSFLLKFEKLEVNKYTKTLEKEAERSGRGQTALHLAIFTGRADIVKMLINDKRTDVNAIAKLDFCNPFYYATIEYIVNRSQTGISDEANRINRMTIVKLLLNHSKVQTDFVYQKQGFANTKASKLTAFRQAVRNGNEDLVNLFVNHEKTKKEITPELAEYAESQKHIQIAAILKAELNETNNKAKK